jgi:hypothetical protein
MVETALIFPAVRLDLTDNKEIKIIKKMLNALCTICRMYSNFKLTSCYARIRKKLFYFNIHFLDLIKTSSLNWFESKENWFYNYMYL